MVQKSGKKPPGIYMDISENRGTSKSSILIGLSIINHPFWGTPYVWKHPYGILLVVEPTPSEKY